MRDDRSKVDAVVSTFIAQVQTLGEVDPRVISALRFDAGLAWVHFPSGEGGLGVPSSLQSFADRRLFDAGLLGRHDQRSSQRGLFGPVLMRFGTPKQRKRYLRNIFTGEDVWCLLLSEPDAGSDLAGLATSALSEGDHWRLNGQKVWTSLAHKADRGLILARHDQHASRHKGLTAFIVDMHDPGVEVRPIRQMTGDAEFNQVFLTDVLVPHDHRVGGLGEGWTVMMSALATERFIIGHDIGNRDVGPLGEAVSAWKTAGSRNPIMRDRLARLWIDGETIRLFGQRTLPVLEHGEHGLEGTMLKLRFTQFLQDVFEFIVDLRGPDGVLYPDSYEFQMFDDLTVDGHDPRRNFLAARSRTIGGGSSEILRNTIAERVLGLPREPNRPPD